MSFAEEDLLPISGLQHLLFCERQWALIHLERVWVENDLTVQGRHLHDRAHRPATHTRGPQQSVSGLQVQSLRLGLFGVADVVEIRSGGQQMRPVEYKRGRPKQDDSDRVQLCAQALCLEEMLGIEIAAGAIFYGQPRRREEVVFDLRLRTETERAAARLHELFRRRETPSAEYQPKCRRCSLLEQCLPKARRQVSSAARYLTTQFQAHLAGNGPETD